MHWHFQQLILINGQGGTISWYTYSNRSVLLVEKPTDLSQVIDKLYHIMLYTSPWSEFELTTSVVIGNIQSLNTFWNHNDFRKCVWFQTRTCRCTRCVLFCCLCDHVTELSSLNKCGVFFGFFSAKVLCNMHEGDWPLTLVFNQLHYFETVNFKYKYI
jgi:hypothetical protein